MDGTLKRKVLESGYTHKYLAGKIGVTQTYFSMALNGKRTLSQRTEALLKDALKYVVLQNVA